MSIDFLYNSKIFRVLTLIKRDGRHIHYKGQKKYLKYGVQKLDKVDKIKKNI